MNDFEIGYVIGLLVGESSFSGEKNIRPRLSIKMKDDLHPLNACKKLLGGRINGPYVYKYKDGITRTYSMWSLDGKQLVNKIPFIEKYLPPSRKRNQFLLWRKKFNV